MEKKGEVLDNNSSGVTSVVLGILSLVFGLTVFVGVLAGLLLGIIGIFFAINQIRVNRNSWSTAGLVLCILGILLNLAVIVLLVSLVLQLIQQFQSLQSTGLLG